MFTQAIVQKKVSRKGSRGCSSAATPKFENLLHKSNSFGSHGLSKNTKIFAARRVYRTMPILVLQKVYWSFSFPMFGNIQFST